jgi:cell wall-associated NlpC family hydrolase
MITTKEVIDKAREYINVPVVHAGRNKLGIDCVGLFVCVAQDLGLFEYDNVNYSPTVVPERLIGEIERFGTKKEEFGGIEIGDVAVFSVGKYPHHVGLISKYDEQGFWFIHANISVGKVVEQRLDRSWLSNLYSLYRIKGVSRWQP